MFEALNPPAAHRQKQIITLTLSIVAHAIVLVFVVVVPLLYFSEQLPSPPNMLAFVATVAPPAPPPPPPPPAVPQRSPTEKAKSATKSSPVSALAAAPVRAPDAIRPEPLFEEPVGQLSGGIEGGVPGGVVGGIVGGVAVMPSPPPPPPPVRPVRVGGDIEVPTLLHRVNPIYPPVAVSGKVEGIVILEATVGTDGVVQMVRVLRSEALFDKAAIEAVKQWRYSPLLLNGEAYPFVLTVTVNFNL